MTTMPKETETPAAPGGGTGVMRDANMTDAEIGDYWCQVATELTEEVEQLRAQLAAARADGERLDWLEAKARKQGDIMLGWSRADHDYDEWAGRPISWPATFWVGSEDAVDGQPPHAALRHALDAARAAEAGT